MESGKVAMPLNDYYHLPLMFCEYHRVILALPDYNRLSFTGLINVQSGNGTHFSDDGL